MKYTEEEVNKIINLRGHNGEQIDVFRLYGILFMGNTESGEWDICKRFVRFTHHSVPISIDDFDGCEDEDHVRDQFHESLKEAINDRLL